MDLKRILLYIVVALFAVLLFNAWVRDYPPQPPSATATHPAVEQQSPSGFSPTTFNPGGSSGAKHETSSNTVTAQSSTHLLEVKTDVLNVWIDPHGGNIVSATLTQYPVSLQEKNTPVQILSPNADDLYVLQSGLTNTGKKGQSLPITYTASKNQYVLSPGQNQLQVSLAGRAANGLQVTKTYDFKRSEYAVQMNVAIKNPTGNTWTGSLYTQITRRQAESSASHFYARSYEGPTFSSPQTPYEKVPYKELEKQNIDRTVKDGWVAMQQHYFLSAWVPQSPEQMHHYYSHIVSAPAGQGSNIYIVGFVSPQMTVTANAIGTTGATLYVGPEIAKPLRALALNLDRTIDYGWLWFISILLFWIMNAIHAIVRNWGWSIAVTTILIKIVFYWFSAKSFRSMARLREMQPKMALLKERHGDDRQALSKATMELYRKEKINPLGGCLPMIIQIPVFIAFYYVIIESVQLRQAPFIFWIHDLSVKDPYYILPILMGLSMLLQQCLSPTSPDPTQQKMMWILPVVFTVFFINFPAGLVLYWLTNNLVQSLQQWYVNKTYEKHKANVHAKRMRKKNR